MNYHVEERKCTPNGVMVIHKSQYTKTISVVSMHLVFYKQNHKMESNLTYKNVTYILHTAISFESERGKEERNPSQIISNNYNSNLSATEQILSDGNMG